MRPWLLLLLSLLVSDLSPFGDKDWVMENYSWGLYRKLLLNGQMTPTGPEMLQAQTEHHCVCIQRHCVYVAVLHKQRTSPLYWAYTLHDDHGCSFPHHKFTGRIHRIHIPTLVVASRHGKGKHVPAFLNKKSDTLPVLHVISKITPAKAGEETRHIALIIIRHHPDLRSAWSLHHTTAASGHNFQAFPLKKSKSWTPAIIVHPQTMLTKRCYAPTSVIISYCFEKGEIRPALKVKEKSEQQMARPQIRLKESKRRAMKIKVHTEYDGQRSSKASLQAATLHSGISSRKTSDKSRLEIHRKAVRIIKKDEHLNSVEGFLLHKSVQRQRPLKAASCVYNDDDDNDDEFYVKRQLLLVSREKTESINRPQYKMRAAQDHNKEDFSGKIITKQAEFRHPEGEHGTEQSSTIENRNQEKLAYNRQAHFTHEADNNDVDRKQMLTEAQEDVLILLFPTDTQRETQTEESSERKLILNTDTGWQTVNIHIKVLDDPQSVTKVIEENFIIESDNSKCKSLKDRQFSLEIYALDRTEGIHIKPAEKVPAVSAYSEEGVKETQEKIEKDTQANNTFHENMSINQTKQEPSEESVIPSPPSLKMMETVTAKTEPIAETTAANMEIKETTSSTEVFNKGSTQKADRLPSTDETPTTTMSPKTETDTEPRFIKCMTNNNNNTQATTVKPFSGLRMREDVLADSTRLHEGAESEERAATNRPGNERKGDQNDPKMNSFTFAKPSQTIHKQVTDELPKMTDDNRPRCGGLIHRTEAGWKHCVERHAEPGSKMFSSREQSDESKGRGEQEHPPGIPPNDDGYDHFYYFDGVLRKVQSNFYPFYTRQKLRKRRHDSTENSVLTRRKRRDSHENLSTYIRHLVLRNKAGQNS